MNLKKTLDSGAVLEVSLAPFKDGYRLLQVVSREIGGVDIELGIRDKGSLKEAFNNVGDEVINTIKNLISRLIASEAIAEALWPCMERATYNNVKINRDLFDDEKIREDYLIVAKEVLWYNLGPFLRSLVSQFPVLAALMNINGQK